MVPGTFTAIKAAASPLSSTVMPNTSPSQAPIHGPQVAAPTTMGMSTSEMEKTPKWMNCPSSWSTTTSAVRIAPSVSRWSGVEKDDAVFVLFMIILLAAVPRTDTARKNGIYINILRDARRFIRSSVPQNCLANGAHPPKWNGFSDFCCRSAAALPAAACRRR